MRLFNLVRSEDVTGVSGTGIVAQGVQFDSGRCALEWLTAVNSIVIYQSVDDLIAIHGHDGKTTVQYTTNSAKYSIGQEVFGIIDNAGFMGNVKDIRQAHDHPLPEYLIEGMSTRPIWCWEGELFLETDKDVHPDTIKHIRASTAPAPEDRA